MYIYHVQILGKTSDRGFLDVGAGSKAHRYMHIHPKLVIQARSQPADYDVRLAVYINTSYCQYYVYLFKNIYHPCPLE